MQALTEYYSKKCNAKGEILYPLNLSGPSNIFNIS